MWLRRGLEAVLAAIAILVSCAVQAQQNIRPSITIESPDTSANQPEVWDLDQLLQLEVFINGNTTGLVAAFTRQQDGTLTSPKGELDEMGLRVPEAIIEKDLEIPLSALPGVSYHYDDIAQTIHFTVIPAAQKPIRIRAQDANLTPPDPERPPLGAVLNYTLFGGAEDGRGGFLFQGVSGSFETRIFDRFGLIENSFIGRAGDTSDIARLDSSYSYQDPTWLVTFEAGDFISRGFSWTRPIRMGGFQIRRSFGLRPDLITVPLPTLTGSAETPSTLDLYINMVRTLSTKVPQGPYEIDQPPMIFGSGLAEIVLRDALGRETVAVTPFYASPELLAPGLTDFSAEIGFARRNYATLSNDYDSRMAFSSSYRNGVTSYATVQAHAEGAGSFSSAGVGVLFTIGTFGLASVAASESHTPGYFGSLIDIAFESRTPFFSLTLRTQRTIGDYEDLASWTAVLPATIPGERRLFGQPLEIDQASVSVPVRWSGSSIGVSYVRVRQSDGERSRLVNFSFTQNLGRLSLFASAVKDFEVAGSSSIFFGLSVPLGQGVNASAGATYSGGKPGGYVEASQQGAHEPGAVGWSVRASAGDQTEAQAIARYGTSFARFEGAGLYANGDYSATGLMEGALTVMDGSIYATPRLDESFALVEVGEPGVTILRENRKVGVTDRSGNLLVPDLAPFVSNRIALDPADLPVDATVSATEATTTPFSRVATRVNLNVKTDTRSALLTLVDPQNQPIELGSRVQIEGQDRDFVVGYDGQAYVEDLNAENIVLVTTPDGAICRASFHYVAEQGEQVRSDALVCALQP